jgi:hypothetical protein
MSRPFLFPAGSPFLLEFDRSRWKESSGAHLTPPSHSSQFSTQTVDKLASDHLDTPSHKALTGLQQLMGGELFG